MTSSRPGSAAGYYGMAGTSQAVPQVVRGGRAARRARPARQGGDRSPRADRGGRRRRGPRPRPGGHAGGRRRAGAAAAASDAAHRADVVAAAPGDRAASRRAGRVHERAGRRVPRPRDAPRRAHRPRIARGPRQGWRRRSSRSSPPPDGAPATLAPRRRADRGHGTLRRRRPAPHDDRAVERFSRAPGRPARATARARTGRRARRRARATWPASKTRSSGSPESRHARTSSHSSGVDTVGRSRARSE